MGKCTELPSFVTAYSLTNLCYPPGSRLISGLLVSRNSYVWTAYRQVSDLPFHLYIFTVIPIHDLLTLGRDFRELLFTWCCFISVTVINYKHSFFSKNFIIALNFCFRFRTEHFQSLANYRKPIEVCVLLVKTGNNASEDDHFCYPEDLSIKSQGKRSLAVKNTLFKTS